jgi:hypothetical protein
MICHGEFAKLLKPRACARLYAFERWRGTPRQVIR